MPGILKKYPYKLQNKYPGMRLEDEVIWDEFIKRNPAAFFSCYYNVPVGDPMPHENEKKEAVQNGGYDVSQWRIDVLAETADGLAVIELKPHAGPGALGQALAYKKLIEKEWQLTKPVVPIVITNGVSSIMLEAAAMLGVQVIVI